MKVITTNGKAEGRRERSTQRDRYLSDCTDIYVTFDVDSLDSSISKEPEHQ
jgi:arginase